MAVFRLRLLSAKISNIIPASGWFNKFSPVESSVVPNEVYSLMLFFAEIFNVMAPARQGIAHVEI